MGNWNESVKGRHGILCSGSSIQFSRSLVSDSLQPLHWGMLGFPIHHQLLELAQTHVHQVSNAIQPSHPLMPSSSALILSQHQRLFQWVSCLHQFSSVTQSCPPLCNCMDVRLPCPSPTPGACSNSCPLSQWWQPSHPMSSLSSPAFNLSQHQGLF